MEHGVVIAPYICIPSSTLKWILVNADCFTTFFFVALDKKIYIEEDYFVIYSLGAEIFMKMWSYYTSIQETK